mgnify:CR=1 FL=1
MAFTFHFTENSTHRTFDNGQFLQIWKFGFFGVCHLLGFQNLKIISESAMLEVPRYFDFSTERTLRSVAAPMLNDDFVGLAYAGHALGL